VHCQGLLALRLGRIDVDKVFLEMTLVPNELLDRNIDDENVLPLAAELVPQPPLALSNSTSSVATGRATPRFSELEFEESAVPKVLVRSEAGKS